MSGIKSIRIVLDRGGVAELLRSSEVQAMLDRKAEAVASAARGRGVTVRGVSGEGEVEVPVKAVSSPIGTRARSRVILDHPAGLRVESTHRLLVGSLDAARR